MAVEQSTDAMKDKIVVILKGYPRLSETFIAQEILGLESAGLPLELVSLRLPTDKKTHPIHDEIKAPVTYLPEYLHLSPWRVLKGALTSLRLPGFGKAFKLFLADLRGDWTRNRIRRFGQAMVLANEWPKGGRFLYAHFIHTPSDVAYYTSHLLNIPWSASAHAKDIWTSENSRVARKLDSAAWTVTCTAVGHAHLQSLASEPSSVHLSYHGLNLDRFPLSERSLSARDGSSGESAVVILSVGRAVKKKGYDILLKALAMLPPELHWKFIHVGAGDELTHMNVLARTLNIDSRITWAGAIDQTEVLAHYKKSDIFALACRVTADGDRDGLPNVLVEAASQSLACLSTKVSGIEELFKDNVNGRLVNPEDPQSMSDALALLISDPVLRLRLGKAAEDEVRATLDYRSSIQQLLRLFEQRQDIPIEN